jgi:hypothetical protein
MERKMVVACHGFEGPTLFFVKVEATKEQVDEGLHYEAAEKEAKEQNYDGPFVCFDEDDRDGPALLPLFAWESASVVKTS